MRKIFATTVLAVLGALCLVAGAACEQPSDGPTSYVVTFVQEGQASISKVVEEGKTLTDIPELPQIKGHTVAWSVTDFTNVSSDMTVELIKTPNKYKIYLDATSDGTLDSSQESIIEVEYGTKVPIILDAKPNDEDYSFSGWYDTNGKIVSLDGMIYEIEGDLHLKAKYSYVWIGLH